MYLWCLFILTTVCHSSQGRFPCITAVRKMQPVGNNVLLCLAEYTSHLCGCYLNTLKGEFYAGLQSSLLYQRQGGQESMWGSSSSIYILIFWYSYSLAGEMDDLDWGHVSLQTCLSAWDTVLMSLFPLCCANRSQDLYFRYFG